MSAIGQRSLVIVLAGALIAGLLFAAVVQWHTRQAGGNVSVLLHVSERAFNANPMMRGRTGVRESLALESGGYDGQYNYFATFDPLVRRYAHAPDNYALMYDAAPYRLGRIGHAWIARLLAGTRWRGYPATLVWTVVAGVVGVALLTGVMAVRAGHSAWWGLSAAAVPGYWQAAQTALPEPIAGAFLLGGFGVARGRYWPVAIPLFACALLTRETGAILVAATAAALFLEGRRRPAVLIAIGSVLPVIAWRAYVGSVLSPALGWEGYWFSPGTFSMPLTGIVEAWTRVRAGTYYDGDPAMARAAVTFSGLLVCTAALALWSAWRYRGPLTAAAAGYAVLALALNFTHVWNHVGNVQRTSSELFLCVGLAAATVLPSGSRERRIAGGLVVAAALFVLFGAHDAAIIRQAILTPFG